MIRFLKTNDKSSISLIARLVVAVVVFPHGAQKLLGWFGGEGFSASTQVLTEMFGIPWLLGFLVILVEFFGSILLTLGFLTRFAALAIALNFIGVLIVDIGLNQFFMNWSAVGGQGEGLEYFVLLFGLVSTIIISGGGKFSLDAFLTRENRLQPA